MILFMPNKGLAIDLQPSERTQLEQWESAHGTPQQVALRCRIILGAVAGQQNVAIAEGLGVSRPTVQLWRKRVHEKGIGEVWEIAPGRGRKVHYTQEQRDRIIKATLQSKPEGTIALTKVDPHLCSDDWPTNRFTANVLSAVCLCFSPSWVRRVGCNGDVNR